VIPEIERMEMPDWLCRDNFEFDVYEVVNNSLYYPACGTDGTPVKYFMGNVYSFVYVDYADFTKEAFYREISNPHCFWGYHIIHRESIFISSSFIFLIRLFGRTPRSIAVFEMLFP